MTQPIGTPNRFVISTLTLAEIITMFGDRPDPGTGARVRFPLRGCRAQARRSRGTPASFPINVHDLGFRGIGFTTREPVQPGDRLVIELHHLAIPPQAWPCSVVRATRQEGDVYRVGATFEVDDGPNRDDPRNRSAPD